MTAMESREQIIRNMLARYKPVDVPGYVRRRHGIIVTHDEVHQVNLKVAAETGRRKPEGGRVRREVPDDFAAHAHKTNAELAAFFGARLEMVTRWRNETGLAGSCVSPNRPVKEPAPTDLRMRARLMTRRQLCEHYRKCSTTIDGWLKSINCRAKPGASGNPTWSNLGGLTKPHDARENSEAGRAAKFMQGFWPTYRCDLRGNLLADGAFWKCGREVMSDAALIVAADEKRARDIRLGRARAA